MSDTMQVFNWAIRKLFYLTPVSIRHKVRDLLPDEWVYRLQCLVSSREWQRFVDASSKAKTIEAKLWGGFSEQAKIDLLKLRDNELRGVTERARASWALARWYWLENKYQAVMDELVFINQLLPREKIKQSFRLLEIDCLLMLREITTARNNAEEALQTKPSNVHYKLALSNTYSTPLEGEVQQVNDDKRLEIINSIFIESGLSTIGKKDPLKVLALDNISGLKNPYHDTEASGPVVSVIVPVYKAEDTLPLALKSVLAQSWRKLQVIVVDDCSPDSSYEVAQAFAEQDKRILVLRQEKNQGAYAARNLGLLHATGEFVTTHDADDWSHPQKIEVQIRDFLAHSQRKANLTYWVRALPDLHFKGTSRPSERLVQMNHSSLMLRRELLLKLGGWDRVRITGDTELIWRLGHHPEGGKPAHLLSQVPLSFALEDVSSLTRNSRTHVRTMFYGVRREYREAITHWHQHTDDHSLPYINSEGIQDQADRPFPAPGFIHAIRKSLTLDRLMLMDFNAPGPAVQLAISLLDTWEAEGLNVGVFQWRYYPLDVREPLNKEIRDRALDGRLTIIAPGESVESTSTVLFSPPLAEYAIDLPPQLKTKKMIVMENNDFCCLVSDVKETWSRQVVTHQLSKVSNVAVSFI